MQPVNKRRASKQYLVDPRLAIDESATQASFGYAATSLSPSSPKKVVYRCAVCSRSATRDRRHLLPEPRCNSCSKTKQDLQIPAGPIDVDATFTQYGYLPKELNRYSASMVVGICTRCDTRYLVRMKTTSATQMCKACERTTYWASTRDTALDSQGQGRIHEEETLRRFGYSGLALSARSNKRVVYSCSSCQALGVRQRKGLVDTSRCRACVQKELDHQALQQKRQATISDRGATSIWRTANAKRIKTNGIRWPNGMPQPKKYGVVTAELRQILEQHIGRKLQSEVGLQTHQRLDLADSQSEVAIEYCGLHWHHEHSLTPRGRNYHRQKMLQANAEGWRVITVFEDEYVSRPEAVIQRLVTLLGGNEALAKRIAARDCRVVITPGLESQAAAFLDRYHVQGSPVSALVTVALYHQNTLVGVLTGGQHHRQNHEQELILSRLCYAPQTNVVGGSERLYKYLVDYGKTIGATKIVTWADNRWTTGAVYRRLGMIPVQHLPPDYAYVVMRAPKSRISKQSQQRRKTGCPDNVTERTWALQSGLSRIWDCGKVRWEKEIR